MSLINLLALSNISDLMVCYAEKLRDSCPSQSQKAKKQEEKKGMRKRNDLLRDKC